MHFLLETGFLDETTKVFYNFTKQYKKVQNYEKGSQFKHDSDLQKQDECD